MHCVFFFGTHDYAWIMETDLKPYLEFKETLNRDKKSANFKKAIDEIEEFLAGKGNFKTSSGTQAAAALASAGILKILIIDLKIVITVKVYVGKFLNGNKKYHICSL